MAYVNTELTLGDFVKQIAVKVKDMPFKREEGWHILFYKLQNAPDNTPGKPRFLKDLRFDWDGPYPKSQELSDFIQALHWNSSAMAGNPSYEKITIPAEISQLWESYRANMDADTLKFIDETAGSAKQFFEHAGGAPVA